MTSTNFRKYFLSRAGALRFVSRSSCAATIAIEWLLYERAHSSTSAGHSDRYSMYYWRCTSHYLCVFLFAVCAYLTRADLPIVYEVLQAAAGGFLPLPHARRTERCRLSWKPPFARYFAKSTQNHSRQGQRCAGHAHCFWTPAVCFCLW